MFNKKLDEKWVWVLKFKRFGLYSLPVLKKLNFDKELRDLLREIDKRKMFNDKKVISEISANGVTVAVRHEKIKFKEESPIVCLEKNRTVFDHCMFCEA